MELLLIAFVAGALTVLAPCILPLLPIIVGGSIGDTRDLRRPFIITASLAVSVIVFTLALKATTALLGIPPMVWEVLSGGIIIMLGATMVWPKLWEGLGAKLNIASGQLLGKAGKQQGIWRDIATGAALGPVFNSCSPTYALVVAAVLPASFGLGLVYLVAYALGLSAVLLLVALAGQKIIAKLRWAADPNGAFRRWLGIIFIVVGIFVATGLQKAIEAYLVQNGWYDTFSGFERYLLD